MLDAYIIDAIIQEERAREEDEARIQLEIPLEDPFPPPELVYRAPTADENPRDPVMIPMVPDVEEDAA